MSTRLAVPSAPAGWRQQRAQPPEHGQGVGDVFQDVENMAHRLAGELLSLPCDHRHGPGDMRRVVDALRDCDAHPAARL